MSIFNPILTLAMPALRSPLGSQSVLLDSVQMDTGDFTPAANSRKRKKAGTPPPATGLRLIDRIAKETDKIRNDLGAALLHVKAGSLKELAACFVTIIGDNVLGGFEAQANALSDLAGTMTDMTKTFTSLQINFIKRIELYTSVRYVLWIK